MMKKKEDITSSSSENIITLTPRQTSILVATLCMVFGGTFLTGYFWGKRSVVVQFAQKVEQDSFADQIYASLCALYDYEPDTEEKVASNEIPTVAVQVNTEPVVVIQESNQETISQAVAPQVAENSCDEPVESLTADQQEILSHCYAELIGFGSENSATLFANKLLEKGYDVAVKKRISHTANSKKVAWYWYQVVTQPYQDKDALQEVVDRIAQEEKLKGIRIVFV